MKKHLLIVLTLILSSVSFGQGLSKEDKVARKELWPRLWQPQLKWLTGMDNRGYETYYTNEPDTITYEGLSEEFNTQKEVLEKYFLSNLFAMRLIGKSGSKYIYFPKGWAYSDSYYNLHLKRYKVMDKTVTLTKFYDFTTPQGPALVAEFKQVDGDEYFHGLILMDELNVLMDKQKKGQIGVFEDERDGQYYKWSKIGEQKWMAENLKYKLDDHKAMTSDLGFSAYKGRFYNYSQAMTSCPKGWHLPSDEEWKALELLAGVWPRDINLEGYISREGIDTLPGPELIGSSRLMFFAHLSGAVSESFGRYSSSDAGERGYFWTSTKSDEVNAMFRMVGKDFKGIARDNMGAQNYFNCRCVEDEDISVMVGKYPKLKAATDKITADPSNASNYFDRSIEFLLIGEGNRALEDINKAIELNPEDPEQKLFKAQILYLYSYELNADETRKLVADYTATVKDNAYAYYFQSKLVLYDAESGALNVTRDQERRKESVELINKALEIDSKNPQFLDYHAKLLVVTKDYAKAVKALEKALLTDPNNGDTHFLLGKMKLRKYDQLNKKNGTTTSKWCTAMTGVCFKVTTGQLEAVCKDFTKAISLGAKVDPDYLTICNELEQAKTLKKYAPIIHIGPRGGRYTISSGGNKVYIPRR
jgi:uncharacterized protein (TIGR02145 family)